MTLYWKLPLYHVLQWCHPKRFKLFLHDFSPSTMANINEVTNGFYEALLKVRYPGVTNIDCGDLENTILAQNDRNKLLHWLLVESLRAVGSTSDEPGADDASLVKWYVQLGLCDNKAALLGHCPIKDQLDTLIRLTKFIMNVLGVNGEVKVIPDEAENVLDKYLNTQVNLIPPSFQLTTQLSYNEAKRYMKKLNERMKEHAQPNPIPSIVIDDEACRDKPDGEKIESDEKALQSTVEIVEKFCTAFQDIDKWTSKKPDTSGECVDNYIDNIHNNFSILKETLQNKNDIVTAVIPIEREVEEYPLDRVFQDTVVGLEELRKVCDESDYN